MGESADPEICHESYSLQSYSQKHTETPNGITCDYKSTCSHSSLMPWCWVSPLHLSWRKADFLSLFCSQSSYPEPCHYNKFLSCTRRPEEKKELIFLSLKKVLCKILVNSVYCFERLFYVHSLKVEGPPSRGNHHVEGEATLIYVIFKVFGLPVTLQALKLK